MYFLHCGAKQKAVYHAKGCMVCQTTLKIKKAKYTGSPKSIPFLFVF